MEASVLLTSFSTSIELQPWLEEKKEKWKIVQAPTIKRYQEPASSTAGSSPSTLRIRWSDFFTGSFRNIYAYLSRSDELYVTFHDPHAVSDSQTTSTACFRVVLLRSQRSYVMEGPIKHNITATPSHHLRPGVHFPSGGCAYRRGYLTFEQNPSDPTLSGLFYTDEGRTEPLVSSYGGKPLNSIQHVAIAKDGALWFTDCSRMIPSRLSPTSRLPPQVYRFEPASKVLRVMADGLVNPSGICFSPSQETVYVSDIGTEGLDTKTDAASAATIYAYDVLTRHDQPFLKNKRVFAYATKGVPKSIKSDASGNIYAACGDGIEIWGPGGVPLSLVAILGGCTDFCFGKKGEIFACAGEELWRIEIGTELD